MMLKHEDPIGTREAEQGVAEQSVAERAQDVAEQGVTLNTTTPGDIAAYAQELVTRGVTVIPVLDRDELQEAHADFLETVATLPEFRDRTSRRCLSGFGAIGTTSSFHNDLVRRLRAQLHVTAVPLFSEVEILTERAAQAAQTAHTGTGAPKRQRNLEQLFDRMSIRYEGTSTSSDKWHRDESTHRVEGDDIFGGWLNLDLDRDQAFSCVPGTHRVAPSAGGFAPIKDAAEVALYARTKQCIVVPPGHWVVFYQHLVHEVAAKKQTGYDSIRLYVGFRLTCGETPLFPEHDTEAFFDTQALPRIPSGQVPEMYAKLHLVNWLDKLSEWATAALRPQYLTDYTPKSGARQGRTYRIPHRHLGCQGQRTGVGYTLYLQGERELMRPRRQWTVRVYDVHTRRFLRKRVVMMS
jgi:hypothetical protein